MTDAQPLNTPGNTITYTVLLPDGTSEEHTAVCIQGIQDQKAFDKAIAAVGRVLANGTNGRRPITKGSPATRESVAAVGDAPHHPAPRPQSEPAGRPLGRPATLEAVA